MSKQSHTLYCSPFFPIHFLKYHFALILNVLFSLWFLFIETFRSENMVSDRIPDRKVANIAASLVAAAATANGSIDEKERELNEVITGLQILREELIRRVSFTSQSILFWTQSFYAQNLSR